MNTKKRLKIIVPACILVIIAGIWIFKNAGPDAGDQATPVENEDFALEAEAYDLEVLTSYGLPMILDFGSESCDPCREMAPALKTINAEMQGKAIVKYVDVWKHPSAAEGYPIQLIPTQVFIGSDGTPYVPSDDIAIEFTMYSYTDTGEHALTTHVGGLTEEQMRLILADMGVDG